MLDLEKDLKHASVTLVGLVLDVLSWSAKATVTAVVMEFAKKDSVTVHLPGVVTDAR